MKAITVTGRNTFQYGEIPEPDLGDGEVRIRVSAVGICGTDVEIFRGNMFYFTSGQAQYPIVPGHEWTGEVVELGPNVTGFAVGDQVVGECSVGCARCRVCLSGRYHQCHSRTETGILNRQGGLAEFIVFPSLFLHKISSSVERHAAALVEPTSVAFNGVRKAGVSPADAVVIFGDGPIGLLVLQVSRVFGASAVVLVGMNEHRLELAAQLGADKVVNAGTENVSKAVQSHLGNELASVAIEATGNPAAVLEAMKCLRPGGRIIVQGLFGDAELTGLNLDQIVTRDIQVIGALSSPSVWPSVIRLVEAGAIQPGRIVSKILALPEYEAAIRSVEGHLGIKCIIEPTSN